MIDQHRNRRGARRTAPFALLFSVSALALGLVLWTPAASAQQAGDNPPSATTLPPVVVEQNTARPRRARTAAARQRASRDTTQRQAKRDNPEKPAQNQDRFGSQDARTGTVGVYANSTSVATKTNTPLVNIPQSLSVVTKDFIRDQAPQSLTDVTRYVPGVAVHQGEGNRDELVIRGVDSSANFFVNGFRDDVQYFRDLYNAQSVEVLKGPSALTFGRGAGGGLLNRTLKEADGTRVYDATAQTGSFGDRRFTLDAGQAVNENVAVRFNAFYEGSDTFRDFGQLERYGINPTVTLKPNDNTKVKLSYEYFHDERTADRGNPSQATQRHRALLDPVQSGHAVRAERRSDDLLRQPDLNVARADVQTAMAIIDHDFENGLTVQERHHLCRLQEILPERLSRQRRRCRARSIRPTPRSISAPTSTGPTATTPSTRPISSTRPTPVRASTRLASAPNSAGRPASTSATPASSRTGTNTIVANPFSPTYFGPVNFIHHSDGDQYATA